MLFKSYVPGDRAGNIAFGAHALLAGFIAFGGALQLVPQLRSVAPWFHRWNGRAFLVIACGLSLSGLYLTWLRPDRPSLVGGLAISANAILILAFAVFAWRTALARDFASHRRWALRVYLVANAQWFTRVGFMAFALINGALHGPDSFADSFFRVWQFGCYLVPLAVLELYLRANRCSSARAQYTMAVGLLLLALLIGIGSLGAARLLWWPLLART